MTNIYTGLTNIEGSNFIASGKNIDITLYPVFYDIIEMNRLGRSQNGRFELAESQLGTKKEALNLNGGNANDMTNKQIQDKARVLLARHRRASAVCFLVAYHQKQTGFALDSLAQLAKLAHPRSIIQN